LLGKGNVAGLSEANIFFTGENSWKKFDAWPPKNVASENLYFGTNGKLFLNDNRNENSDKNPSFDEYTSDPAHPVPYTQDVHERRTREYMDDDQRFASRRPDVLTYETEILIDNVTLAGPVIADLMASISTTDADFIVKLIDVFPDDFKYSSDMKGNDKKYPMGGYQMLVRGEIMRGKFHNSFEKPEPFVPRKITEVKWELPDVAHTFLKGHRIMIQVQSSWFPLADRNPQKFMDIYKADNSDFQKASIRIYHDASNRSKIILPVLKN
jgi:putative CocE/NonD family hydrolase